MKTENTQAFCEVWDQCAELYSKPVSEGAKMLAFKLLINYSLQDIQTALQAHMTDPVSGQFMPKPADVVRHVQNSKHDGWLGEEEAWARFPRHESQSACIYPEMVEAWGVACFQDEISGRMAFKETYSRLVAKAKSEERQPAWYISFGDDKEQRQRVTLDAVRDRFITAQAAAMHLPHVPIAEIEQVVRGEITTDKLLESHAPSVNSVDQLLLETPKAEASTAKLHIQKMMEALR